MCASQWPCADMYRAGGCVRSWRAAREEGGPSSSACHWRTRAAPPVARKVDGHTRAHAYAWSPRTATADARVVGGALPSGARLPQRGKSPLVLRYHSCTGRRAGAQEPPSGAEESHTRAGCCVD